MTRQPEQQVASVTFRHGPHSQKIEALCHAQAEKLFRLTSRLTRCDAVIDPVPEKRPDAAPDVKLILHLPGGEVAIHEAPGPDDTEAATMIRRAFATARRLVVERVAKRRDASRQSPDR